MTHKLVMAGILAVSTSAAGALSAAPIDGAAARQQLFPLGSGTLQVSASLGAEDAATIRRLVPMLAQQMGGSVGYYSAIAFAPADGLVSESLQSAVKFHSPEAADAAALKACEAAKSASAGRCTVAARIAPKGYGPRDLTLSEAATDGFIGQYLTASGRRALAASAATGEWAVATGPDAGPRAVAECNKAAGTADCSVKIADD